MHRMEQKLSSVHTALAGRSKQQHSYITRDNRIGKLTVDCPSLDNCLQVLKTFILPTQSRQLNLSSVSFSSVSRPSDHALRHKKTRKTGHYMTQPEVFLKNMSQNVTNICHNFHFRYRHKTGPRHRERDRPRFRQAAIPDTEISEISRSYSFLSYFWN